jgi:predicted enzyme related to lactoylglutathione lyase
MALADSTSPVAPPLSLGRVVILVRDYDAALAFYRAAFGARVVFDAPSSTGDRYLHVTLEPEAAVSGTSAATPVPAVGFWLLRAHDADDAHVGRQTAGHPLAVLYTPDVRTSVTRVQAAGGTLVRPVQSADSASFAHVADLYGNEFVLVELPELSNRDDRGSPA